MSTSFNKLASLSKTPSLIAYHVRDKKGSDAFWTRIGTGWDQRGDGVNA